MKDDKLYLIHINERLQRIEKYIGAGGKDDFIADEMMQDAVIRNLQTMAESTQRLSGAMQDRYPEVVWLKIRGFRNLLVHDYLGVDIEGVWNIVENDLPKLKQAVDAMLKEPDN